MFQMMHIVFASRSKKRSLFNNIAQAISRLDTKTRAEKGRTVNRGRERESKVKETARPDSWNGIRKS